MSCINHLTSSGTSSVASQFCAGVVDRIPASLPLQLMEQLCEKNPCLCKSLLYSIRSHCGRDHREPAKKHELHKMVTQEHEYKMWVARGWGGMKGAAPGWKNTICRRWGLRQVEKGDELTVEWTDREEEQATGEGTSLRLEQNGSEMQQSPSFRREAFCFCCSGNAPPTTWYFEAWVALWYTPVLIHCSWKKQLSLDYFLFNLLSWKGQKQTLSKIKVFVMAQSRMKRTVHTRLLSSMFLLVYLLWWLVFT